MLIKKVHIEKFRGFHDQEFEVGSMLTAIAGQNGTQKSTLLGMITQTFLHDLSEADELWENITEGYSKQVCFRDITYDEILHDRIKAKTWFPPHPDGCSRHCTKGCGRFFRISCPAHVSPAGRD